MSGQQERWDRLDLPDQPDLPDSTLIMARLLGRDREPGHGLHGNGRAQDAGPGHASEPAGYLAADPGAGRHRSTRSAPAPDHDRPVPVTRPEAAPNRAAGPELTTDAEPTTRAEPTAGAEQTVGAELLPRAPGAALPAPIADRSPAAQSPSIAELPHAAEPPRADVPAQSDGPPQADEPSSAAEPQPSSRADNPGTAVSAPPVPARPQPAPVAVRPEPGSWADLRQRLERLPHGHPSSPYHVDGERKPPPPRLKHLELAPPAREVSARSVPSVPAGAVADADAAAGPGPLGESPDEPPESVFRPVADDTAERPRSEHPGSSAAGYAASGDERPELPRSTARLAPPRGTFEPAVSGTTESTPRGTHEAWARGTRDSGTRGGAGGRADPPPEGHGPGSGQGRATPRMAADGSWAWGPARLTRNEVRIAEDAYDRFRAAEGRSLFGGYGANGLTATMRRVEEQLAHARLAPDTEERAVLEPDVFRARLADMLRRHPDRTPEQLARRVPGALSYVFILEAEYYAEGIRGVQEALEIQGFQLQARKNSWNSPVNRCVFTIWHDRLNDLPFQVQFHTAASLEAQHLARSSATLINDPRIPPGAAAGLRSELASAWAALPAPPGNADIADYRRAGDAARR